MDKLYQILIISISFVIGIFVSNYLPKYMDEKGKNLATKEDISDITD